MTRRLATLLVVLVASSCAVDAESGATLSGTDFLAGKADAAQRLRAKKVVDLTLGKPLSDVLRHSVVDVELDLNALFDAEVRVEVPRDFYAEVALYALRGLDAGTRLEVAIDGPDVVTVVKRVPTRAEVERNEDTPTEIHRKNRFRSVTERAGEHAVMVFPSEIEEGADRIAYEILVRRGE